jgi:two-component system LytT family sensor kinase
VRDEPFVFDSSAGMGILRQMDSFRVDRRWAAAAAAAWLTLPLLLTIQEHILSAYVGQPMTWRRAFIGVAPHYLIWGALALPIFWLSRRFPIERPRFWRRVFLHLLLSFVFYGADAAISSLVIPAIVRDPKLTPFIMSVVIIRGFYDDFVLYWCIVGVSHLLRQQRERAALEREFTVAQLEALRAQLQPHFLFNTLNSVSELMHIDIVAAERMVDSLSGLLRVSLDSSAQQEIPLREELEILDLYLRIQQVRFSDSVTIERSIDPAALDALVPTLLLQPLVENAFRHGLSRRRQQGLITITARRQSGEVCIEVRDNGAGLPLSGWREGIGLGNTRARLAALYGSGQTLTLAAGTDSGASVAVSLPYRTLPREES